MLKTIFISRGNKFMTRIIMTTLARREQDYQSTVALRAENDS